MGKVKLKCDNCGKIIEKLPSEIEGYKHHFCNRKCQGEWQSKNRKGEKSSAYKGGKVKVRCDNCGESIERVASEAKRNSHNFCNRTCHNEWQRGEENRGRAHPNYGKHRSAETRGRISANHADVRLDKNPNYGKLMSEEQKEKMREVRKTIPTHHTKPELIFEALCKKYNFPFKYTGDSAFWIGGKPAINPDFIHLTKKIVVEIFSYWHDPLRRHCNVSYSQTYEGRKKILKKRGWKMIVFWQEDLECKDAEQFVLHTLREEGIIK